MKTELEKILEELALEIGDALSKHRDEVDDVLRDFADSIELESSTIH